MPASRACLGVRKSTSWPSKRTVPEPRRYAPVRILIMVDLPAPFWPISACTSPAATLRFALRRAGTPPKLIWMSCISRSGERPALGDGGVGLPDCVTSILLLQMRYGGRGRDAPPPPPHGGEQ